jgi:CMP-N,N'-diacetyllegionaminic acid synthase
VEYLLDKQHVVAIIPARGGSVGIPKKNLMLLCGKPLLGWTIDHALDTKEIDEVYVSTDDDEIAEYAVSKGVQVIRRPVEISGGDANSESAIQHVLTNINLTSGYDPDIVIFLQATSPLRKNGDISAALNLFRTVKADSLFSSSVAADLTIWNKNDAGWESINFDYKNRKTRQTAPVQFVENGSIYIFYSELITQTGNRLGGKIESYVMAPWQLHEIDVEEDVELIEYYMEKHIIGNE